MVGLLAAGPTMIGCRCLEQRSDVLLGCSLDARRDVPLHANVGSTNIIKLCPCQGLGSMNGVILRKIVSCGRLDMSVPA
eukprot:6492000-Amphidinium_carterae.1